MTIEDVPAVCAWLIRAARHWASAWDQIAAPSCRVGCLGITG